MIACAKWLGYEVNTCTRGDACICQKDLSLIDWLKERADNCRHHAELKPQDRAGWLEGAAYFDFAIETVKNQPRENHPSAEAVKKECWRICCGYKERQFKLAKDHCVIKESCLKRADAAINLAVEIDQLDLSTVNERLRKSGYSIP